MTKIVIIYSEQHKHKYDLLSHNSEATEADQHKLLRATNGNFCRQASP
jgi:hypothetical protein